MNLDLGHRAFGMLDLNSLRRLQDERGHGVARSGRVSLLDGIKNGLMLSHHLPEASITRYGGADRERCGQSRSDDRADRLQERIAGCLQNGLMESQIGFREPLPIA